MSAFLALLAASWLPAQEPAPAPPFTVNPQEILAAIEAMRSSYDTADQRVREAVERPAPAAADRSRGLADAEASVAALIADMEKLLELLPKPSEQQSSSSSSSSSSSQESRQPSDGRNDPRDPRDSANQEQTTGRVPPPTGPPLEGQPPANYGRWGLLPPRLQEALQNSSMSEVPSRYRRWLEEYHRRGQQPR